MYKKKYSEKRHCSELHRTCAVPIFWVFFKQEFFFYLFVVLLANRKKDDMTFSLKAPLWVCPLLITGCNLKKINTIFSKKIPFYLPWYFLGVPSLVSIGCTSGTTFYLFLGLVFYSLWLCVPQCAYRARGEWHSICPLLHLRVGSQDPIQVVSLTGKHFFLIKSSCQPQTNFQRISSTFCYPGFAVVADDDQAVKMLNLENLWHLR